MPTTDQLAKWSVTAAPIGAPVTWAEAKSHLRLDTDTQQAYVESLIDAATDYAEDRLSASLMERTMAATFYADEPLMLPRGPVLEVLSITDADADVITDYATENIGNNLYVIENEGGSYPITITYRAGHATAAAIPAGIRLGILIHVATLFENRESVSDKAKMPTPHSLDAFYRLKSRFAGVG